MNNQYFDFIKSAKRTITLEREAINQLLNSIGKEFVLACQFLLENKCRIVVMGMGKSGHIGNKIAATFASTGTPAFFVHPGEAHHGDIGMIKKCDIIIAISHSGYTQEIINLLPYLKKLEIKLISITGNPHSTLAKYAIVNLNISVPKEACPLNLAPTSSTTVSLVLGDALAIALLEARGFTENDFALSHPGGMLGRRLLLKVEDIMHYGNKLPKVFVGTGLTKALLEITQKGLGMTIVLNKNLTLAGIFTDGDLRRTLDKKYIDLRHINIEEVMTVNAKVVYPEILAMDALKIMEEFKINSLVVIDINNTPIGALNIHDFLNQGLLDSIPPQV